MVKLLDKKQNKNPKQLFEGLFSNKTREVTKMVTGLFNFKTTVFVYFLKK